MTDEDVTLRDAVELAQLNPEGPVAATVHFCNLLRQHRYDEAAQMTDEGKLPSDLEVFHRLDEPGWGVAGAPRPAGLRPEHGPDFWIVSYAKADGGEHGVELWMRHTQSRWKVAAIGRTIKSRSLVKPRRPKP
jgi:hypothetical protein